MIKVGKWYRAIDKYDGESYVNFFFKVSRKNFTYISAGLGGDAGRFIQIVKQTEDEFDEEMVDSYDFEEYELPRDVTIKLIYIVFTGEVY